MAGCSEVVCPCPDGGMPPTLEVAAAMWPNELEAEKSYRAARVDEQATREPGTPLVQNKALQTEQRTPPPSA